MTPNYSLIPWIQWVISRIHANTFFKTSKNLNKKKKKELQKQQYSDHCQAKISAIADVPQVNVDLL